MNSFLDKPFSCKEMASFTIKDSFGRKRLFEVGELYTIPLSMYEPFPYAMGAITNFSKIREMRSPFAWEHGIYYGENEAHKKYWGAPCILLAIYASELARDINPDERRRVDCWLTFMGAGAPFTIAINSNRDFFYYPRSLKKISPLTKMEK